MNQKKEIVRQMGTEIQTVKQQVRIKNWEAEVEACNASGLSVQQWCCQNGISAKTYYYHLRKVSEAMLSKNSIVALGTQKISDSIEINTDIMNISVPADRSTETLAVILKVLQNAQ